MTMEVVCAALAGICARILCHPLDTIKTVSFTDLAGQADAHSGSLTSSRFAASARQIWQGEGIRGFFRGVGVATLGSAPGVALYLGSYHVVRDHIQDLAKEGCDTAKLAEEPSALRHLAASACSWMPSSVIHFVSGLGAETVSCLVWVPIDVSKERLQSQPPSVRNRYRSSWDALTTILSKEGVHGLYRGYWSTLLSFGPFSAIYFVFYEYFTEVLTRALDRSQGTGTTDKTHPHTARSFLVPLLSGAGGNIVASLCTNPLELVKTRMQVQRAVLRCTSETAGHSRLYRHEYKGMTDGLRSVVKEEGWLALWRGVGPRIAYTAPNAALTMMFFQYFMDRLAPQAERL